MCCSTRVQPLGGARVVLVLYCILLNGADLIFSFSPSILLTCGSWPSLSLCFLPSSWRPVGISLSSELCVIELWPGPWRLCCRGKCVWGAPTPSCSPTVPMAKLTASWKPLTSMPTHTRPSVSVPRCVSPRCVVIWSDVIRCFWNMLHACVLSIQDGREAAVWCDRCLRCLLCVSAAALDEAVARARPSLVLELGMHCGYSSVRLLRLLPPAGRLLAVEVDPLTAELGEEILLVAGFKHPQVHKEKRSVRVERDWVYTLPCFSGPLQFQVLMSSSAEAIPTLRPHLGADKGFGLVLMDHDPRQYLPDLLALEREELLSHSGSILLINRGERHDDVTDVVAHVRARPDVYTVTSERHFMLEIVYHKRPTNEAPWRPRFRLRVHGVKYILLSVKTCSKEEVKQVIFRFSYLWSLQVVG